MNVLVLQHIACEPPGVYEEVLVERAATIHRVELDEGEPLPDWREFDAIVAMGGPMSVNDDSELPWLSAEKSFIAEAVRAGTPFFGACLGVQLLAVSLGGEVSPGPAPEVGLLPTTEPDTPGIDNSAHLGGGAAGLLLGFLLPEPRRTLPAPSYPGPYPGEYDGPV